MPTNDRIRAAIIELSEQIEKIGYEPIDVIGPINESGEEIPIDELNNDRDEMVQYYLTGRSNSARFFIVFSPSRQYATITYPLNVLNYLGSDLNREETEQILDEEFEWDDIDPDVEPQYHEAAAKRVVENTDTAEFREAAFNLSIYASSSAVNYQQVTMENGFPQEYQCVRGIFVYDEQMSLSRLDDRLYPVLIAGERGKRYLDYSFRIDRKNKSPDEYCIETLI